MIASPQVVGNASNLNLRTLVDGVISNTNDLLFGVEEMIELISQGTTLEQGTVVMTGTPSGVAMGINHPLESSITRWWKLR